jgi:hypothetical protein
MGMSMSMGPGMGRVQVSNSIRGRFDFDRC